MGACNDRHVTQSQSVSTHQCACAWDLGIKCQPLHAHAIDAGHYVYDLPCRVVLFDTANSCAKPAVSHTRLGLKAIYLDKGELWLHQHREAALRLGCISAACCRQHSSSSDCCTPSRCTAGRQQLYKGLVPTHTLGHRLRSAVQCSAVQYNAVQGEPVTCMCWCMQRARACNMQ
jgi:hypothetical protein